jgi:hypothetical protein
MRPISGTQADSIVMPAGISRLSPLFADLSAQKNFARDYGAGKISPEKP